MASERTVPESLRAAGAGVSPPPEFPAWAVVTTRGGGAGTDAYASLNLATHVGDDPGVVAENRRRAALAWSLPTAPAWLEQVHGTGGRAGRHERGAWRRGAADAAPGRRRRLHHRPGGRGRHPDRRLPAGGSGGARGPGRRGRPRGLARPACGRSRSPGQSHAGSRARGRSAGLARPLHRPGGVRDQSGSPPSFPGCRRPGECFYAPRGETRALAGFAPGPGAPPA